MIALVAGVGGAALFFWFLNLAVEGLPERLSRGVMPYAYVLPAFAHRADAALPDRADHPLLLRERRLHGVRRPRQLPGDLRIAEFRNSIFNNVLWLIIVPAVTVAIGVIVAVLADKLSQRGEKTTKGLVFLPMAISFVGASAIWGLIYAYDDPGSAQTGLLNAIWTTLGGDPVTWLNTSTLRLNSLLMMVILIWLQVGFAMILLSSAIKGVPEETIEAARIDGATELQIFWRVVIPQIKGTIITVFITVTILVLKVFDIVYVLTNGNFNSNVIANLFFNRLFADNQAGQASAIVVVLLIAVTPILVYQVKHFRDEEAAR